MPAGHLTTSPFSEAQRAAVRAHVARYGRADAARAIAHLVATLVLFGACLVALPALASAALDAARAARAGAPGAWGRAAALGAGSALAVLVQAATLVKLFMIHHDLMHGAFFASRWANRAAALLVGTLCSTSPSVWRREHDRHHAHSNDLDEPQDGQTAPWTVEQYLAAPRGQRFAYWLLNRRGVLFTVAPLGYFLGFMRVKARWYENLAALAMWAGLYRAGLVVAYLVPLAVGTIFGFVMFHAQHTFAGTYRRRHADWDYFDSGMLGASFFVVPSAPLLTPVVRFFLHGVEYHHVHHLNPRIAGYAIRRCHDEGGALFDACPRVTPASVIRSLGWSLYDEAAGGFRDVRTLPPWVRAAEP